MTAVEDSLGLPSPISQVIDDIVDIFDDTKHLPPIRLDFDHMFPLKEGTEVFNMRPYRYSTVQKTITDQLVLYCV